MSQASSKENLLIIGSTGYIGAYITEQIVKAKDAFSRIVIFTSPATARAKSKTLEALKEQGVEVIIGDVRNADELLKAFTGINTVISAIGRAAIAEQVNWIKLLLQAPSVKRFFPSEYGTDIEYGPAFAHEIPHQQKLKVRAALRVAESEGLDYTYVVTGPYADGVSYMGAGHGITESGSFDVKAKTAVVIGDGKGRISLTTPPDVGRLVVKALLHPAASRNRALRVNSFTTTPLDIVAGFEKQTGGEKWQLSHTSMERACEIEKQWYAEEKPWAVAATLRRIWAQGGTLYEQRDNRLINADNMETLEDAVRDSIQTQLAE